MVNRPELNTFLTAEWHSQQITALAWCLPTHSTGSWYSWDFQQPISIISITGIARDAGRLSANHVASFVHSDWVRSSSTQMWRAHWSLITPVSKRVQLRPVCQGLWNRVLRPSACEDDYGGERYLFTHPSLETKGRTGWYVGELWLFLAGRLFSTNWWKNCLFNKTVKKKVCSQNWQKSGVIRWGCLFLCLRRKKFISDYERKKEFAQGKKTIDPSHLSSGRL